MGVISWSLFSGDSSHVLCHMAVMCLRMMGLKSEGGMRQFGSARRFGSSIGTLVTADADMARKPAEVNVEADALSDVSLEMISSIMGWSILKWSSACRHDMESV